MKTVIFTLLLFIIVGGIFLVIMPDSKVLEYKHKANSVVQNYCQKFMTQNTTSIQGEQDVGNLY